MFVSRGNHPSVQWLWERVKEGTPTTCALAMLREEGYQFDNVLFRDVYRAMRRYLLRKRQQRARYYERKGRKKRGLQDRSNRQVSHR